MLVGLFLKNYKTYQHLTFLPFVKDTNHNLSIFIGQNGAGKSSILESLDTLFNGREWNSNIFSKKTDGFICPVFLIPKHLLRSNKCLDTISSHFWNYNLPERSGAIRNEASKDFIQFRNQTLSKFKPAEHYLIVVGRNQQGGISYTSSHKTLETSLKENKISISDQEKTLNTILNRYAYTYLPIHSSPADLLNLRAREIQSLLDKNFIKEIEDILNKDDDSASPIKSINLKLENFITEINEKLQSLSGSYQYKTANHGRVLASDLTDTIINKSISRRLLQKDGKPIQNLSSGEQRLAIIDVAYAFLSKGGETTRELIIAIDEPEVSLNPTNCLQQFKRIFSIANDFKKQVFISTHWYGLLMAPENATLNHISKLSDKPLVKTLNLAKIQEERRAFPDSFEMKSYFDLVSSILSTIKGSSQNWIICEGNDDLNYLKKLLPETTKHLNILPVGGKGGVVKIYEYMRIAAEDKAEQELLKGKVLCLIDTDTDMIAVSPISKPAQKKLRILRFQICSSTGNSLLVPPTSKGLHTQTELEDTLDPVDFYNASKSIVQSKATEEIKKAFQLATPNKDAAFSGINQDLDFLTLRNEDHYLKKEIRNFLTQDHIKSLISERYYSNHSKPAWVETVEQFFNPEQNEQKAAG